MGVILACIFLIFFGTIKWLSSYTLHGEFVEVPDFKGQSIERLADFVKDKNVAFQVIDSIYDPKEPPGTVLRQDPEASSKVKHNRTVYLYVTGRVAPKILMPRLIDRSERQARLILVTYGLRLGKVIEKKADCNGCVVAQMMKGQEVADGAGVKKGSVIDLVIGKKDSFYNSGLSDTSASAEPDMDVDAD